MAVDSNTDMITQMISKDIFLADSTSDKKCKLCAYEKCIEEIRERVTLEEEVKVGNWWRGSK